ncbi:hypothetical protein BsWGS_28386 [Bradybaena similaris]
MATTASSADRRNQVMIGELPADFLRAETSVSQVQENAQVGRILQAQQQAGVQFVTSSNYLGALSICVVQARLTKNYGLTKMDPYCRVRVGNMVFETQTDYNGAKTPRWNKTVTTNLPAGVDSLYIELFDERSFTLDNRIAWGHIQFPEAVLRGETVDTWFPLSGKQGDGQEGSINLVLSVAPPGSNVFNYGYTAPLPVAMPLYYPPVLAPAAVIPAGQFPRQAPYPPQQMMMPMFTDEDLKQVKDMFPNMDDEVVKSVLEANHGNKDAAINSLLAMSSE